MLFLKKHDCIFRKYKLEDRISNAKTRKEIKFQEGKNFDIR